MELSRLGYYSQFLSLAVRSLTKAQEASLIPLPIVSALLAQAEGSLGSKEKWEKNLRLEWPTWPPGMMLCFLPTIIELLINLAARYDASGYTLNKFVVMSSRASIA